MSAWAAAGGAAAARVEGQPAQESLSLRLAAFFALGAFAAVQYATLLAQPPVGRLLAVAALASAGGGAIALSGRSGRLAAVSAVLAAGLALTLGLLAIGIPAHLLVPTRWGELARELHRGYLGLSGWLWPYRGGERSSQLAVLSLVPAVLTAAALLCFWPRQRGAASRRAAALMLLIGLFVTGAANQTESAWRFQGAALTLLLAAWLWLPRVGAAGLGRAGRWLLAGALLALLAAPTLVSGAPWIDYRAWNPVAVTASFRWDQVYGPMPWSRSAATMLEVADSQPQLLRVTSLDRFDGVRFLRSGAAPGSARLDYLGANWKWLVRATVSVSGIRSDELVSGGGVPLVAQWFGQHRQTISTAGDGTATLSSTPVEGDTYRVLSYSPAPSAETLRAAPRGFPRAYLPYTQFALPDTQPAALLAANLRVGEHVTLAPPVRVGAPAPGREPASDPATVRLLEASPYAPMFTLARRLAAGASNAFEVVQRVQRFLVSNYRYDENVPNSRYPLVSFLFSDRRGYCQQFSGAMTLLLRMDGIPARVAAGFRPGVYDATTQRWRVRALDAHSWVEVYFSGIGWVPFDPTPARGATAPSAQSGLSGLPSKATISGAGGSASSLGGGGPRLTPATAVRRTGGGGSSGPPLGGLVALGAGAALALAAAGWWLHGARRLRRALAGDASGAVAELRRALAQLGQPTHTTLASLEGLLDGPRDRGARRYVRSLRELRYGAGSSRPPTAGGRRALRRALAARAGRLGLARALLALPPGAARRAR